VVHLWGRITELPVGLDQKLILFQRWVLSVEEEADETVYWMELLVDADVVKRSRVADLLDEANQILSIVISSIKTAKGLRTNPQSEIRNQKSYA
jgi:hypothetical protein